MDLIYIMIMDEIQQALKKRYSHLHPLIFQRSLERASSAVELFDILETVPTEMPIVWDEDKRLWVHTDDLVQSKRVVA